MDKKDLRDMIAMHAMQALVVGYGVGQPLMSDNDEKIAKHAYRLADAMMEVRKTKTKEDSSD